MGRVILRRHLLFERSYDIPGVEDEGTLKDLARALDEEADLDSGVLKECQRQVLVDHAPTPADPPRDAPKEEMP